MIQTVNKTFIYIYFFFIIICQKKSRFNEDETRRIITLKHSEKYEAQF